MLRCQVNMQHAAVVVDQLEGIRHVHRHAVEVQSEELVAAVLVTAPVVAVCLGIEVEEVGERGELALLVPAQGFGMHSVTIEDVLAADTLHGSHGQ